MSKCLRCGAGNEWIEPVRKEAMTPPKKRPKVRYRGGWMVIDGMTVHVVCNVKREPSMNRICDCYTKEEARRIAAALNWHTAYKRGEL